jgi:hypothetical protein
VACLFVFVRQLHAVCSSNSILMPPCSAFLDQGSLGNAATPSTNIHPLLIPLSIRCHRTDAVAVNLIADGATAAAAATAVAGERVPV